MGDYWDDPTDTSTGFLTHFVGIVRNAYWSNLAAETKGKVSGSGSDRTQLFWEVEVEDILQEDYEGTPPDTITVNFGTGTGWWPTDDDNVVEHEDYVEGADKNPRFKDSSGIGMVLSCVKGDYPTQEFKLLDEGGEIDWDYEAVASYFRKNKVRDASHADIWNNMRFEFRGMARIMRGQEGKPRAKPFPTKFLGTADEAYEGGSVSGSNNSAEAPASATEGDVAKWKALGATTATASVLVSLERNAASHEDFVSNAQLIAAVKEDEKLLAAVGDPSNFTGN